MAASLIDTPSATRWASAQDGAAELARFRVERRKVARDGLMQGVPMIDGRVGIGFWRALPLALLVSALLWGAVVKAGLALL